MIAKGTHVTWNRGLLNPGRSTSSANFVISTDLHFNSETCVLTALCELPGLSKNDVTVVLSTNPINRVKQVVVATKARQDIAHEGYIVRERKLGSASRTFVVPSETTVRLPFPSPRGHMSRTLCFVAQRHYRRDATRRAVPQNPDSAPITRR